MSEGVWGRSTGTGTIAAFSCSSANTPSPIEISHRSHLRSPPPYLVCSPTYAPRSALTHRFLLSEPLPAPLPPCDPCSEGTTTL